MDRRRYSKSLIKKNRGISPGGITPGAQLHSNARIITNAPEGRKKNEEHEANDDQTR